MIKVNNPNQLNIFDPWAFVTPKRRQMLDAGWPGLFREHILPSIPVNKVSKYFNATFGRPTKELYSMLGALILQQTFDFTDEETMPIRMLHMPLFSDSMSQRGGIRHIWKDRVRNPYRISNGFSRMKMRAMIIFTQLVFLKVSCALTVVGRVTHIFPCGRQYGRRFGPGRLG
jgi:hypothetical protein